MKAISKTIMGMVMLITVCLINQQVVLASINGLWGDSQGQYWLFAQGSEGTDLVMGARITGDLTSASIMFGQMTEDAVTIQTLYGDKAFEGNFTDKTFTGTYTLDQEEGVPLEGSLILAYQGGSWDGLWLTSLGDYVMYVSVSEGSTSMIIIVDIVLNDDGTMAYELFVGAELNNAFTGTALFSSQLLMIDFTSDNPPAAEGTYTISGFPPEFRSFSANQIFSIGSGFSLTVCDLDGDGTVVEAELEQCAAEMDALSCDTNTDGALDTSEIASCVSEIDFLRCDRNGDGHVDEDEMEACAQQAKALACDANGDGTVDASEQEACTIEVDLSCDQDGDGNVTDEEREACTPDVDLSCDQDGDGSVTDEEREVCTPDVDLSCDQDGDGQVDRQEIAACAQDMGPGTFR